ncbi:type III PLP-dependent enzyme [Chamaesiphon sp. VAR_69_metabat_338]|uniref:type III PLP-dependent enzyme n=1 Tax=Chamaesiphon sp. VAR_69_metabat_338 TaxID=2964704 RepID=UPI00286E09F1|nr:type III PLP-dependent enzyme [Chamaesiphon sp. VAR_69_metabat_338]
MPTAQLVAHARIFDFIASQSLPTPYLVVDLPEIKHNYQALATQLPDAQIYYALKANPAPEILQLLVKLGASFDAASLPEIQACLSAGARPHQISFGNTIKKAADIATAYELGVRLFAFDSLQELEKLAVHAAGSQVYCRLLMECTGAEWPLSRKFGCELDMAKDLLIHSDRLGLQAYGVSFHVGSQQLDVCQWEMAIATSARLFRDLAAVGVELQMLNVGGGFPARYRSSVPELASYTSEIDTALARHFENQRPIVMLEPGRSLVADAGIINTEVVLISQKSYHEDRRWVFLDIGKFGGLAETMDEAIRYRLRTPWDGTPTGSVILAGPTCDSADILYERSDYQLPLNLQAGDRIQILSAGAYTSTYASVGFNGFAPLAVYCI